MSHPFLAANPLIKTALLAGLIGVTFLFSRATLDPFHALRWAWLALAVIAGTAAAWKTGGGPASASVPIVLAAGYALFSIFSWVPAVNKAEALWQIAQSLAWCAWFSTLLTAGSRDASLWTIVRRAAVLCALLGASIVACQYWGIWNPLHDSGWEPVGLQGNRNLSASLQFLLAPWTLWALAEERGLRRFIAAAAWAGFCYTLAVCQCRAVWLGCLAASLVFFALAPFAVRSGHGRNAKAAWGGRVRRQLPLAAFLIAALSGAFLFHGLKKPDTDSRGGGLDRAATILDPDFDSNAQRLALWKKTAALIANRPLAGVGAGNWKIALPSTGMSGLLWQDMSVTEVRPYNDWLWTVSEIGIPGGLCWLGLWLAGLWAGLRTARAPGTGKSPWAALLLTSGLSGFGIVSALDFPKERPEHMAWYAAGLAALFTFAAQTRSLPETAAPTPGRVWMLPAWLRGRKWAPTLILLMACGAAAFSGMRWRNEALVRETLAAQANRDWQGVLSASSRIDPDVLTLNPAASPMAWHAGIARYQLGDRAGAERDFRRALLLHPYHIHSLHNLAVCRLGDGDTAEALVLLRRSLDISPGFTEAALAVSQLSLLQGSYAPARKALDGVEPRRRGSEWHSLDGLIALHERNIP